MKLRRYYRGLVSAGCGLAASIVVFAAGGETSIDGLIYDLTVKARAAFSSDVARSSAVVVIALDQRTLDAPEFRALPRVFLAPYWAKMLDGIFASGARAVGFDLIFAWSANRFKADHDQPFIAALARYKERVVLARSAQTPVAKPFYFAVGAGSDNRAVGYSEIVPDVDGIFRRVMARFPRDEEASSLGFAAAVLNRAGAPEMPETVLLAPTHHLETIPTYSLVDVVRCSVNSPEALRRVFNGKIVLVGSSLPEEDRKTSADRFLAPLNKPVPPTSLLLESCELSRSGASNPRSSTVPGVFIHAAAVDTVASGLITTTAPGIGIAILAGIIGIAGAWLGFRFKPWFALIYMGVAAIALFATGTGLLAIGIWLPTAVPTVGGGTSVVVAYLTRYVMEERRRLQTQKAFGRYLSPFIVEELSQSEAGPELGGEERDITIMFADLSGFTRLSGEIEPRQLMELTNRYLSSIVEAVEAYNGYVDKFIGDAVMAIWGAPIDDPKHAVHGTFAALEVADRIAVLGADASIKGEHSFGVKIGLLSGTSMVGNVGSEFRYNYTAVGEVVNIASRLESVPPIYRCPVVIGESVALLVEGAVVLCELDLIKVKGRDAPVRVYQPLANVDSATESQRLYKECFEEALACYRSRRFDAARKIWRNLNGGPPSVMADRATHFLEQPPPANWDGVWELQSK